ncbi:MAG: HAD hydrolase-like protein, partial [Clostridia bacterium]|nr:HAD hydrolase-like protein [Clostridia bacterium]
ALLYLVRKHDLDPKRCIMVGDRVLDVEAGLNAGMCGALFDPDDFCKGQAPTPYQYPSMDALRLALVEEDTVPAAE